MNNNELSFWEVFLFSHVSVLYFHMSVLLEVLIWYDVNSRWIPWNEKGPLFAMVFML